MRSEVLAEANNIITRLGIAGSAQVGAVMQGGGSDPAVRSGDPKQVGAGVAGSALFRGERARKRVTEHAPKILALQEP